MYLLKLKPGALVFERSITSQWVAQIVTVAGDQVTWRCVRTAEGDKHPGGTKDLTRHGFAADRFGVLSELEALDLAVWL